MDPRIPRPRILAGVNDQVRRVETKMACPALSRALIEWLDRAYPEVTAAQDMTDGALRMALGRRQVVQRLAAELAKQETT